MKQYALIVITTFISYLTPTLCFTQDSLNVTHINTIYGSIDGSIENLVIENDYAIVSTSENSLLILDISNPRSPEQINSIMLESDIEDFAVYDDYIFISQGEAGIVSVNIENPLNPQRYEAWEDWGSEVLAVENGMLYTAFDNELFIIDISDPSNPEETGSYTNEFNIYDIAVVGDYLYLAARIEGFQVIDISDPASPAMIRSVDQRTTRIEQIIVLGQYGYTIGSLFEGGSFRIYEVSNPANPELLGEEFIQAAYDENLDLNSLGISGNNALIPFSSESPREPTFFGIFIVNISDYTNPRFLTTYELDSECLDISIADDLAYLANDSEFRIYDISNPQNPSQEGHFPKLQADGISGIDQAYLNAFVVSQSGLSAIDVSDPSESVQINHIPLDYCSGIDIIENHALISVAKPEPGEEEVFFHIADIKEPAGIDIISVLGSHCFSTGIVADTNHTYIIGFNDINGLFIYDSLEMTGSIELSGELNALAVSNNIAFVTGSEGLTIIDVANPDNPVVAANLSEFQLARDLDVDGDYVYIVDGENGMFIVDVSDPSNPSIDAHYESEGNFVSIKRWFDNVVIADSISGIRILNVQNPANPHETGYYLDERLAVSELRVYFPYAYVGAGNSFHVFDIEDALSVDPVTDLIYPSVFSITSVFPNPFNSQLRIDVQIGLSQNLQIFVYNILGQQIAILNNGILLPGEHSLFFNGGD
ncbi:beta-propeller domain-containing protein, partial [Calditrichota bacterium]